MADFKSMYYHLAGRTATTVDVLEAATDMMTANVKAMAASVDALVILKEKLKLAQQATEDMFLDSDEDDSEDNS